MKFSTTCKERASPQVFFVAPPSKGENQCTVRQAVSPCFLRVSLKLLPFC